MKLKRILPYFLITLAVSLAYFNCLQNEFVWDDEFLIEKNTYLRSFEHLPKMLVSNSTAGFGGVDNFYRPTQNVYYLLIYQMFGYDKVAFHLGNILLHLLNGFLMFLVVSRLFENKKLASLSSLLWVTHPTHVEAIGYISGTADPMGLLFFLLSLLIFPFNGPIENWKKYGLCLILFILSLVSKEAMIVMPGLYMLIIAVKNSERRYHWKNYLVTLPFWILAFSYLITRKFLLNFNQTYEFYKTSNIYTENIHYRIYTFVATLPEYLKILFLPVNLHMERSFPVHANITNSPVLWGFAVFAISLATVLFLHLKKNNSLGLFSWLWFFAAFVPMMGILVPVNSFILEHWLYLPSVFLFVSFVAALISLDRFHPQLASVTTFFLCGSLIFLTHDRNKDWRTPITFYSNILKYSEGSARVHNNLAMAFSTEKNFEKAIEHYLKALETSDSYPQTHYNLARAYIQTQQYQKALEHLNRSLQIRPDFSYSKKLKSDLVDFLNKNSH